MSTKLSRSVSFLAFFALVLALALPTAARPAEAWPAEARPLDAGADGFSLEGLWAALVALWTPSAGAVDDTTPLRPDLAKDGDDGTEGDGVEAEGIEKHWAQLEPGG